MGTGTVPIESARFRSLLSLKRIITSVRVDARNVEKLNRDVSTYEFARLTSSRVTVSFN